MEKQPNNAEASILVCWNPEIARPGREVVESLSRFIGGHYLLIGPVTSHTSVIPMSTYHELGGVVEIGQQPDETVRQRINEAKINPDLN